MSYSQAPRVWQLQVKYADVYLLRTLEHYLLRIICSAAVLRRRQNDFIYGATKYSLGKRKCFSTEITCSQETVSRKSKQSSWGEVGHKTN